MDIKTLKTKANALSLLLIKYYDDDWDMLLKPVLIGLTNDEMFKIISMARVYYCYHTKIITEDECIEIMKKIEGDKNDR